MKRYWKMVVLVPLIVVCIGTYYVEAAGGDNPGFYLKFQGGNEKEASLISLEGMHRNEPLSIRAAGSEYRKQSFWKSLEPNYYNNKEYEKLVKEHRQFMRGKQNPNGFYEDDRMIGYLNIESKYIAGKGQSDFRFNVSIYDKKQGNSSSFEVQIPKENTYNHIGQSKVQIVGQTMKIFTFNRKTNESNSANNESEEVHLYMLDLVNKTVTQDLVILKGDSQSENNRVDIATGYDTDSTLQGHYAVFQRIYYNRDMKDINTESSRNYIRYKRELFVYDMESGKLSMMQEEPINGILNGTAELSISLSGDDLFITAWADSAGPRVIRYNLTEKQIKKDVTIAISDLQRNGGKAGSFKIADNRFYMLVNESQSNTVIPGLAIADLDTGKIVYQGIIARKDNERLNGLLIDHIIIN